MDNILALHVVHVPVIAPHNSNSSLFSLFPAHHTERIHSNGSRGAA